MKVFLSGSNPNSASKVAGIATVMKVIYSNPSFEYQVFGVGRNSDEKRGISWFFKSIWKLFFPLGSTKINFSIAHINTCMNPVALIRDYAIVRTLYRKVPIILHLHGGMYLSKKPNNILLQYVINNLFAKAQTILVLSEIEKKEFPYSEFVDKVRVLKNCLNIDDIPVLQNSKQKGSLLYIGRFDESKGIEDLVEALKILIKSRNDFHLNVCGAGPLEEMLLKELNKYLPNNFTFHGIVSGLKKWELFGTSEIFTLPSRWGEGLPMALLESMYFGLVPIVTDDASMKLIISDMETGCLVPKKDPVKLANKISSLLDDEELISTISFNSRKYYKTNFSLDTYFKEIEKIYTEAIK